MSDNKKYYYIKLKEDFFDSEEMQLLESMPDGFLYSNILLKLYLKSLKGYGKLLFNNSIPYNLQMLAVITRHQVGTVEKAIKTLKELGLIEILDNGTIYMLNIENFVGKSSSEADRIRDLRRRNDNDKSAEKALETDSLYKCTDSLYKCTPEIRDKSIENIYINNSLDSYKYSSNSLFIPTPEEKSGDRAKENPKKTDQNPNSRIFIQFPLIGGKTADITEEWCDRMQELYGSSVNVRSEIKLAIAWCESNHLKKDWKKFLNNWFSSTLKKGGSKEPLEDAGSSAEDKKLAEARRLREKEEAEREARKKMIQEGLNKCLAKFDNPSASDAEEV